MISTSRRFGAPQLALSVLATAALLSACGGGGSRQDPAPGSTAAPQSVAVSGVASKGLLGNALVQAYLVGANGRTKSSIGKPVRTLADGSYTLSGLPANAVVLLEVTADAQTTMLDEATGKVITPPAGFTLRAAVKPAAGGTTSAHITVFSELAVDQALTLPSGLSAANVEASNAALTKLLGVNPLIDAPKFDSNGKPTNEAGAKLAAISLLASKDAACPGTQALKVACEVGKLANSITEDADAFTTKFNTAVNDAVQKWPEAGVKTKVGSYTKPVDSNLDVTAVALAKSFIKNLRSNARAVDSQAPGAASLVNQWKSLSDGVTNHLVPANEQTRDELAMASNALSYYLEVVKNKTSVFEAQREFSSYGSLSSLFGSCGLYQDASEVSLATSPSNANYVICRTSPTYLNNEFSSGSDGSWNWSSDLYAHRIVLSPAPEANTYKLATRLTKTHWTESSSSQPKGIETAVAPAGSADNLATIVLVDSTKPNEPKLSIYGDLAATFSGTGEPQGDKQTVNVTISTKAVSATLNQWDLSGDIGVVKAGKTDGAIKLLAGSYVRFDSSVAGNALSAPIEGSNSVVYLKVQGVTPDGGIQGSLLLNQFAHDKSGQSYVPQQIEFTGKLGLPDSPAGQATPPLFDGVLKVNVANYSSYDDTKPDSASNFVHATASFVGVFHIASRPDLKVKLDVDGSQWSNGYQALNITGSYAQDLVNISFSALYKDDGLAHNVTLNEANGLSLTYVPNQRVLPLLKNGVPVALFDTDNLRVTYADNTFEQF